MSTEVTKTMLQERLLELEQKLGQLNDILWCCHRSLVQLESHIACPPRTITSAVWQVWCGIDKELRKTEGLNDVE